MKTSVIIADDHTIVRDGIKALLSEQEDIVIIGEASNGSELFRLLSLTTADIILLDISMPDLSGIEICERLRTEYPQIKVLFLSMYTTEEYIFNAIKAGAHGYLPKNISQPELLEAIRSISQGREYFNETISNIILKSYINKAKNAETENDIREHSLSKRELEVLRLFAEGFSNSEIGTRLFISPRTVESHKNHIMQKINLKSPVDLIKFAIKNHIVEI
ncbi:Oxygen regulatory protein NreC [bioreactor metagenome]|jgi:DNA-binding NarL/FixJ family response regulator|uniref:Oxygen regulatory protein NreC n=1 Tax=bioreactor metagenome TaxID=1076179 RepID=A0A644UWB9_9ZZZZ|nr:response regulator transcription factor [Lentimicrobium sp.]MEA5110784.1 response regulator transcription factor [Lentimicrobium sp.]HCT70781.1 DNA-binding response regulator [Bacteroidales bacterium]